MGTCLKHIAVRRVDRTINPIDSIINDYVLQGIDVKQFMEAFDMPDTFFSWFLVTELHVWLMGARLMQV